MHLPERGSNFTTTTTIPTDFKWYFHTLELIAQVLWQAFALQSQSSRDPQGCGPSHQAASLSVFLLLFRACDISVLCAF